MKNRKASEVLIKKNYTEISFPIGVKVIPRGI